MRERRSMHLRVGNVGTVRQYQKTSYGLWLGYLMVQPYGLVIHVQVSVNIDKKMLNEQIGFLGQVDLNCSRINRR
jgi:hypothetical protein